MNSYYNTKGVREICHDVKNTSSNKDAILTMAEYFSDLNILDGSSIIIPAPQHYGYADYTLQIAERVSTVTGAKVLNILKCHPRDMLYDLKKQGKRNAAGLYLSEDIKLSGKYFFLDNVISTGKTFREACSVTKLNLTALVYAVDETNYRPLRMGQ
ncbi:MAG: hypothetical protein J6I68_11440 [Butyrivibrio sp.]|uniref:hypothetical protein n=1 Tax=Butyrivibrio sp. TaxID=28121 RepID=UPI001B792526|nr:hypothetical protein [Butyrivibrio sp.]MBP3783849.1 hypothetical protein [Butyrivibrio sp.]